MAYPVTLNGTTYTLADFEGLNYVDGFPNALEDFVTHAANVYTSTSTSSVAIGTGSKTFTIADSDKPYLAGTPLRIAATSDPSNQFMDGVVTSYSGTSLTIDVKSITGSGTYASWNVTIGGGTALTSYNLSGLTVTPTELNILDGDTAATSTTLADADRVVVNDNGTMVQVALTDLQTYFQDLAISGGTIENTPIGATTAAAGTFTQVDIEGTGDLRLQDTSGGEYVALQAPGTVSASYTLTLPTADGTAGQMLKTDGSGALSFGDAGGGGVNTFTANEAISAGDLVSLRTDGRVEKTTALAGTIFQFESGRAEDIDVAFDSTNNKVVIAYRDVDDSNQGKAIVGTVASDGTISYGTAVVFSSVTTSLIRIAFDPDSGKVVIIYSASSNGKAIVGTVSGTSISFGTEATFLSSSIGGADHGLTYDTNVDRVVIVYRDTANSNYGTANVGTISGTSITFGTPAVYRSGNSQLNRVAFCSNTNRLAIVYRDAAASNRLAGFAATATTTTVGTFSSRVEFTTNSATQTEVIYDSNSDKAITSARVNGVPELRVLTVTASAISSGSAIQIITTSGLDPDIVMNTSTNKVIAIVQDVTVLPRELKFAEGTISGTTVTFGDAFTLFTGSHDHQRLVFDNNVNKVVALYQDQDDSYSGKSATIDPATNIQHWIGIAQDAITSGSDGSITTLGGINEGQSGLTAQSKYYLQNSATLGATEVTGRLVGRATSASNIYVTEGTVSI